MNVKIKCARTLDRLIQKYKAELETCKNLNRQVILYRAIVACQDAKVDMVV